MDTFSLEKLEFDRLRQIVARYCRCSLGRQLAERIGPSRRPETVRAWLAQTTEMVGALRDLGTPPFGGITDIAPALLRARPGGGARPEDFAEIASTLDGTGRVRDWLFALGETRPLLAGLAERLSAFDGEVKAIQAVIDERGEVRNSASPRLASIRAERDSCHARIREVAYAFVRRADVAPYLQSTSVQLHDDRYVLPVKTEHRGRLAGVVHRASHTGATVFVEPAECVAMNNRMVELQDAEQTEIARLLGQLSIRVHARHDEIGQSLRVLAQVDLITAKAQYAYQFDMTEPEIRERGGLEFHQARHPLLLEQAYQQEAAGVPAAQRHGVVPIDLRLGQDFDLLIITGSNTGGKTVALKTAGLLVLMAQSGLHLPVRRGAAMPMFRDVLLDVGDEQSLQQSLSTFGAHLTRINHILRKADRDCLVLLDELGSGTDPDEGGAIGQAVLDELGRIGCVGMISTHLGVLKAYAYTHDRADNASVEFDTQTLRPTYRLLIGQPGESHAITVAQHLGLPRRITHEARRYLPKGARQLSRAIRATAASRRASEEALSEAQTAKVEAATRQEQYQAKLTELEQLNERFSEWLSSLPAMQPGDEVPVRKLGKTGRLIRLQLSRQVAVVQVDRIEVEVPLQELMPELGSPGVAAEIATLRRQIRQQARQTEQAHTEAERARQQVQRSLKAADTRQHHFEQWLAAVGQLQVGQEVTYAGQPGFGKVAELNIPAGVVVVEARGQRVQVKFQDLFPATGPFADKQAVQRERRVQAQRERQDRPVPHRHPASRSGQRNREAVLALPEGAQVFVVPFGKRATLVRTDAEKDQAVVATGPFEMQVALADIEPLDETPAPPRRRHEQASGPEIGRSDTPAPAAKDDQPASAQT